MHLALGEGGHVLEGRRLEAAGLEDVGDRRAEVAERLRRVRVEHVAQHLREYERKAIGFFLACPLSFAPISWLLWYVAQNITYTQDFVTARTTTSVF